LINREKSVIYLDIPQSVAQRPQWRRSLSTFWLWFSYTRY